MSGALLDPLRDGVVQRALAEALVLALACGPLGVWVLLHRHAYAAESFSHAMLPGLVLAALAGAPLLLGGAGGMLAAAGLVTLASRDRRVGGETAVAVTVTAMFAAGALLALAPDAPPRLQELLFGDLLGASWGDVLTSAGVAAVVLGVLLASHRSLAAAAFDPGSAPALGIRPGRTELLLLALLGLAIVGAVHALGNLLVLALLVGPAAAAQRLATRLAAQLALAAALGMLAGLTGIYASWHLEIAAGAAVALATVAVYVLSGVLPGRVATPGGRRVRRSPVEALTGTR